MTTFQLPPDPQPPSSPLYWSLHPSDGSPWMRSSKATFRQAHIHMAHVWRPLRWIPFINWAKKRSSQGPQSAWSVVISLPSQDYLFPYVFTLLLLWRLSRTTLPPSHSALKWQVSPYFSPLWWEWAQHCNSCPRGTLRPGSSFLLLL